MLAAASLTGAFELGMGAPMGNYRISRRDAMATAAATALPFVVAGGVEAGDTAVAQGNETPRKHPALNIGVATLGFRDHTNADLAKELSKQGIRTIQLFLNQKDSRYWKYNGRSDLSGMTRDRCVAISEAYRSAGIEIHSIGVYTNLIHPDPAEREANLAYFDQMMAIGGHMGVHAFVTESGHHHPEKPLNRPWAPFYARDEVWLQMVDTFRTLDKIAARHNATVLIEPFHVGFFTSAKRTRTFLEEIDSPRIRALLDPANLLEVNDQEEMFDQLGSWIDCIHAKDRKLHTMKGVAAGSGDLDYEKFVTLAAERKPDVPLIMEYVGADNYKDAHAHLLTAMGKAGLG